MEETIRWAVLRRYSTPLEAPVVRGHLEAAGIPCFLRDEHTIGVNWLYSNALGGVRLCVPEEELERAKEILTGDAEESGPAGMSCTRCGSSRVRDVNQWRRWAMVSLLLFHLPLPFSRDRFRCESCGHGWRA